MTLSERFPGLPRLMVAVMTAALIVVVGSSYATAQTSEPVSTGTLTAPGVGDGVVPGETVQLSGSGFAPGSSIALTMEATPALLRTVTANAAGAFATTVEIPSSITPGLHTLKATGADPAGGLRILSVLVNVTSPAKPGGLPGSVLPRSGSNTASLVGLGLAITVAGFTVLAVRRRRAYVR